MPKYFVQGSKTFKQSSPGNPFRQVAINNSKKLESFEFEHLFDNASGLSLAGRCSVAAGLLSFSTAPGSGIATFSNVYLKKAITYSFEINTGTIGSAASFLIRSGSEVLRTLVQANQNSLVTFEASPVQNGFLNFAELVGNVSHNGQFKDVLITWED